uniref:Transposase n=1 Tax=Peronospora matthiolae TaxID=2874970 RepID=A0AAV1VM67_9STRA
MADIYDKQKEQADEKRKKFIEDYEVGDVVVLDAGNLPTEVVSAVCKTRLRPRVIGQSKVVAKKGLAYTLSHPRKKRTHPVIYVYLLKPDLDRSLVDHETLAPKESMPQVEESLRDDPFDLQDAPFGHADRARRALTRRRRVEFTDHRLILLTSKGMNSAMLTVSCSDVVATNCPCVVEAFERRLQGQSNRIFSHESVWE